VCKVICKNTKIIKNIHLKAFQATITANRYEKTSISPQRVHTINLMSVKIRRRYQAHGEVDWYQYFWTRYTEISTPDVSTSLDQGDPLEARAWPNISKQSTSPCAWYLRRIFTLMRLIVCTLWGEILVFSYRLAVIVAWNAFKWIFLMILVFLQITLHTGSFVSFCTTSRRLQISYPGLFENYFVTPVMSAWTYTWRRGNIGRSEDVEFR
jgi:hypothetical protein